MRNKTIKDEEIVIELNLDKEGPYLETRGGAGVNLMRMKVTEKGKKMWAFLSVRDSNRGVEFCLSAAKPGRTVTKNLKVNPAQGFSEE
tara:strand:- start:248 stop:511 length:264 start_codon:yes stop_codon:yes gene_type:complete